MPKKVLISLPTAEEHELYKKTAKLFGEDFSEYCTKALREKFNREKLDVPLYVDPLAVERKKNA